MTERAEGFWWVRIRATWESLPRSWRILWYSGESLMTHDPRDGGEFVTMRERVEEWGPYLGKGPEDDQRLVEANHRAQRAEQQVMRERVEAGFIATQEHPATVMAVSLANLLIDEAMRDHPGGERPTVAVDALPKGFGATCPTGELCTDYIACMSAGGCRRET